MAVKFTAADSDFLELSSAVVSAPPFTFAGWANSDDDANPQAVVGINATSAEFGRNILVLTGEAPGDPIRMFSENGATGGADTSTGYSVNTWHHTVGTLASTTDRKSYIDGGSEGTDTTSVAMTPTPANTNIGRFKVKSASGYYFSGSIAEVGVWNVVLTDAEISRLADGFAPSMIRFNSLVAYWPLIDDYRDQIGTNHLTAGGSPEFAEHPPGIVYPPERERISVKRHQRRARIF